MAENAAPNWEWFDDWVRNLEFEAGGASPMGPVSMPSTAGRPAGGAATPPKSRQPITWDWVLRDASGWGECAPGSHPLEARLCMDAAAPCFLPYVPRLLRLKTTQAGAMLQEADFLHAEYLPQFAPLALSNAAGDNGEPGASPAPPRRAAAAQSRALARVRSFVRRMLRPEPQTQRPDAASPGEP